MGVPRPSLCPYSPECVEEEFSEVQADYISPYPSVPSEFIQNSSSSCLMDEL
jgi:hypothetical protein